MKANTRKQVQILKICLIFSSLTDYSFVTELSKHIEMRSDQRKNDDSNFDICFPDFIYVLRDFFLELDIDGRKVSADEYLEYNLMLRNDKVKGYTQIRQAIRKYFRNRKCFTFVAPAGGNKLRYLDELPDDKLDQEFLQQANEFVSHIYCKCPVKQVKGKPVTGTSKLLFQICQLLIKSFKCVCQVLC